MTQSDLFLSNQPGASFRAELNQIIESLATNSAGTVAPSPTFPSQWFADYTANMLRRRRKDNTAWIDVSPIDEALLKATNAEIAAGTDATKAITPAGLKSVSGVFTQCRLDFVSTAIIRLNRCNGNLLTIDNAPQAIPSAGVDLAPAAGLTVSAVHFVYAYMNVGVMTLEASSTAYAVDARNGMKVKSGDATRSLVGLVVPTTGPAWLQANNQWGVKSWWNRKGMRDEVVVSASTGSLTNVALSGVLYWLQADDEISALSLSGAIANTNAAVNSFFGLYYQVYPNSPTPIGGEGVSYSPAANATFNCALSTPGYPAGNNFMQSYVYGRVSAGVMSSNARYNNGFTI